MQRYESFENPLAGGSQSFGSQDDGRSSSGNPQFGTALYDFTAGGDDEVGCPIFLSLRIRGAAPNFQKDFTFQSFIICTCLLLLSPV